jgi:hypothetical protein
VDLPSFQIPHFLVHDLAKVEPERKGTLWVRRFREQNCGGSNTSLTYRSISLNTCIFFPFLFLYVDTKGDYIIEKRTKENYKKQDYVFSTKKNREDETTSRQFLKTYHCFNSVHLFYQLPIFYHSCTEEYHDHVLNLIQGSEKLVLDLGWLSIFDVLSYFHQLKIYT